MATSNAGSDITNEEIGRLGKALESQEFRDLLLDYAREVSDPAARELYESEVLAVERERGFDVTFVRPEPRYVLKTTSSIPISGKPKRTTVDKKSSACTKASSAVSDQLGATSAEIKAGSGEIKSNFDDLKASSTDNESVSGTTKSDADLTSAAGSKTSPGTSKSPPITAKACPKTTSTKPGAASTKPGAPRTKPGTIKCFINVCQHEAIERPGCQRVSREVAESFHCASEEAGLLWTVPHNVTPPRHLADRRGDDSVVYDCVYHPDTLRLAGSNRRFKQMIEEVAMDAVENNFEVRLDRLAVKYPKIKFKGAPTVTLLRKKIEGFVAAPDQLHGSDPLAGLHDDPTQSSNSTASNCHGDQTPSVVDAATVPTISEQSCRNADSPGKIKNSDDVTLDVVEPKHSIKYRYRRVMQDYARVVDPTVVPAPERPNELVIEVHLPDVSSCSEVNLQVETRQLSLNTLVGRPCRLDIRLPYAVDNDAGNAKFDSDSRILHVILPVLNTVVEEPGCATVGVDDGSRQMAMMDLSSDTPSDVTNSDKMHVGVVSGACVAGHDLIADQPLNCASERTIDTPSKNLELSFKDGNVTSKTEESSSKTGNSSSTSCNASSSQNHVSNTENNDSITENDVSSTLNNVSDAPISISGTPNDISGTNGYESGQNGQQSGGNDVQLTNNVNGHQLDDDRRNDSDDMVARLASLALEEVGPEVQRNSIGVVRYTLPDFSCHQSADELVLVVKARGVIQQAIRFQHHDVERRWCRVTMESVGAGGFPRHYALCLALSVECRLTVGAESASVGEDNVVVVLAKHPDARHHWDSFVYGMDDGCCDNIELLTVNPLQRKMDILQNEMNSAQEELRDYSENSPPVKIVEMTSDSLKIEIQSGTEDSDAGLPSTQDDTDTDRDYDSGNQEKHSDRTKSDKCQANSASQMKNASATNGHSVVNGHCNNSGNGGRGDEAMSRSCNGVSSETKHPGVNFRKSRSVSESSDDLGSATHHRGILRYTRQWRTLSESSDDFSWSSQDFTCIDPDIPEDGCLNMDNMVKKSVHFSSVVHQNIFRYNSSIMDERAKNRQKLRKQQKRRDAAIRRSSESECSEGESERMANNARRNFNRNVVKPVTAVIAETDDVPTTTNGGQTPPLMRATKCQTRTDNFQKRAAARAASSPQPPKPSAANGQSETSLDNQSNVVVVENNNRQRHPTDSSHDSSDVDNRAPLGTAAIKSAKTRANNGQRRRNRGPKKNNTNANDLTRDSGDNDGAATNNNKNNNIAPSVANGGKYKQSANFDMSARNRTISV